MYFTEQDKQNLEIIFKLARKTVIDSETDTISIINFKKDLFTRFSEVAGEQVLIGEKKAEQIEQSTEA